MPVTGRWTVPPEKLARLRRLAASVWRHGMERVYVRATVVRRSRGGSPVVRMPILCLPSMDALGGLILEQEGHKRSFDSR